MTPRIPAGLAVTVMPDASPQSRPDTFIAVEAVDLAYGGAAGDTLALQDFTLRVNRGEFAAIVGPSGCGKSTLLKLISGLRMPTKGGVIVDHHEVAGPLKIVGMAFQNPTLLPWRNALTNVLLPLQIVEPYRDEFSRKRGVFAERARDLFEAVGLDRDVAESYPWQLSGGMQQRVSLCRALVHEPQLLLLDEPFGALDTFTRQELWMTLQALWQRQRFTVVLVTHDLEEAIFLADTVHVVGSRPGRIVHSQAITLPRPRRPDDRYTPEFGALVRELRASVANVRQEPARHG